METKYLDSKVIEDFEGAVGEYAGSSYGVAVSSQTNAVFLCLELLKMKGELKTGSNILIPKQTYLSIPMTILNVGCKIKFTDEEWSGVYQLSPTRIYDAAVRFTSGMYIPGSLFCVSFQYKKPLPIGRGGMILTDSSIDYNLLKKMRFNGRTDGIPIEEEVLSVKGWNMYMTPEQAARGLTFMAFINNYNSNFGMYCDYPDLSKQAMFNGTFKK